MFKIIKDGQQVGATEAPNYIKLQQNGCYTLCSEDEAQGIVHEGRVYHLFSRPEMLGEEETIVLAHQDVGWVVSQQRADIDYLAAMNGVDLYVEGGE